MPESLTNPDSHLEEAEANARWREAVRNDWKSCSSKIGVTVEYSQDVRWTLHADPSYSVSLTGKMGPCC